MAQQHNKKVPSDVVSAEAAIALVDAALGAAGHKVTDPVSRDIWERRARDEITSEEAMVEIFALVKAGHFKS